MSQIHRQAVLRCSTGPSGGDGSVLTGSPPIGGSGQAFIIRSPKSRRVFGFLCSGANQRVGSCATVETLSDPMVLRLVDVQHYASRSCDSAGLHVSVY